MKLLLYNRVCLLFTPPRASPRAAFTLPELLIVITILGILLGLLYGAIKTVTRYSRETITRSELVNIESAWKRYYDYYHVWPTNRVEALEPATDTHYQQRYVRPVAESGDVQYEIGPNFARMLAGVAITNTPEGIPINPDGTPINTDAIPFLEMTRFDSFGAPVSAWGAVRGQRYFVKLDASGDNMLTVPTNVSQSVVMTTNVFRRVAAWTVHPDKPGTVIGSWQQ